MTPNNIKWGRIGDYIKLCDETNYSNEDYEVIGINRDKEFMPTVANLDSIDLRKYKVVKKGCFVFSGMQTGRDVCIRLSLYDKETPSLISPAYTTFSVVDSQELLPEYFFIYFLRTEMDRFGWFISDSSVRANLDWDRFLDIQFPIPSPDEQQKIVDTWKNIRLVKEQNEAIAEPLFQLCQSYIQELKHKCKKEKLEKYIEEINIRNTEDKFGVESLRGVTSDGNFDNTKAKTEGLNFTNYKVIKHNQFAYNPSRINIGSIALNLDKTAIISPMYVAFQIKSEYSNVLLSEYLNIWFQRPEFQRSTLFYASGSVRDTFNFGEMQRALVPIPTIEIQQAIINIFQCAKEAKRIAEEADKLSREICPALIQKVIHD